MQMFKTEYFHNRSNFIENVIRDLRFGEVSNL